MAALNSLQWFNQPASWAVADDRLTVTTATKSDFWRVTHYGFVRNNGHFCYATISGSFTLQARITGHYTHLYDQAGLMVRQDERHWIKCGIEYVHVVQQASAVITREYSDWSVMPLHNNPESIWLRLRREGETVEFHYSLDGAQYTMLRLGYLSTADALQVGLMCASPDGPGFTVGFDQFSIVSA